MRQGGIPIVMSLNRLFIRVDFAVKRSGYATEAGSRNEAFYRLAFPPTAKNWDAEAFFFVLFPVHK